jgi:hypothetical protein
MAKRSSKKRDHDFAVTAFRVVQEATEEPEDEESSPEPEDLSPRADGKDPLAVALGRRGGKKGGKARAEKLTAEQRSEIARKAAQARWGQRTG